MVGGFIDVVRFVLVFWWRTAGAFRVPPVGKSVWQTSRLGIRPVPPTVEARDTHRRRSRHATPLRPVSSAEERVGPLASAKASGGLVRLMGLAGPFMMLARSHSAVAVVANRFDRTSLQRLQALGFLRRGGGLLKDIGVTSIPLRLKLAGAVSRHRSQSMHWVST